MKLKINKYDLEGVKYYIGFKRFLWVWFPVTGLHRYKEDVKDLLNIY
jgi:hypothetical protein